MQPWNLGPLREWHRGQLGEHPLNRRQGERVPVHPGRVMFELSYPNEKIAREALTRAAHKLPMKCRIVKREAGEA